MPRFAANLTLMFSEVPFLERFERAAKAGFEAVEFQFPYAWAKEDVAAALRDSGLKAVLHNLPAGDWAAGDRGLACRPDRVAEFRDSVPVAIEYAKALGVDRLHCLSGIEPTDVTADEVRRTYVDNLRFAASATAAAGIRLLIEPINRYDIPGMYLHRSAQAIEVMDEVGSDNLFLQYDIYHAQRTEGELAATMQRLLPRISHLQIADNPGRHEPGTGEINCPFLFDLMDRLGYEGWVGCEYVPVGETEAGLSWRATAPPPTPR